jgi:hypothetical protein
MNNTDLSQIKKIVHEATKGLSSKDDLSSFATKEDLKRELKNLASKKDLQEGLDSMLSEIIEVVDKNKADRHEVKELEKRVLRIEKDLEYPNAS